MSLANFKELLSDARDNHYAVPCLIAGNVEMAIGQISAAEEKKSPVILAFPPSVMPFVPSSLYIPFLIQAAKKASVPVAVQLDHGFEYNEIISCIKSGVSAVMFDGSGLEYDCNVARTKDIVKVAHALNVSVEAELGFVGGSISDDNGSASKMTDPAMVKDFVAKTDIDALAISIGNLHGKYKSEPNLDLERLRSIRAITDTPLVLHGGSGLTTADYKNLIKNGISDVHFYSYLAAGVWPSLKEKAGSSCKNPIYHEIMKWTIEYYINAGKNVMDLMESTGKAEIA